MALVLGLGFLTLCALLACASWLLEATSHLLVARRHAVLIVAWAGLTGLAVAISGLGARADPAFLALLVVAALCVAVGVTGATRVATAATGLAPAAAEALLVGSSLVSMFWVLAGSPSRPGGGALAALALTTVDLTAAALIVRAPVVSPGSPIDGRFRRVVGTGVAALCALGLSDGLLTLHQLGIWVPTGAGPALRAVACLAAAAVPWVPEGPAGHRPGPSPLVRALPYLLVAGAVVAQLVAAAEGAAGSVSVVLVALAVLGLAGVQGLALRDKQRLLGDLATSRTRLEALVESTDDVILGIDGAGRVASANSASSRLLHRTPEAMAGLDVAELAVLDDRPRLRQAIISVVAGRVDTDRVELRLAAPATGTAELRLRSVAGGAVANLSDVTEAVELRQRLERLARFDEMTGLANRTHLLDEMGGWLRAGRPVAALYADLDGFKAVNDRFGHARGDDVLIEVGRRLRTVAAQKLPGEQCLVARMGGDEFVIGLLGARSDQLDAATEEVLIAMRPTFLVADRAVRVGLSIGVADTDDDVPAPLDPSDPADLLHRADVAMFAAKQSGRFRVAHWTSALEAQALRRMDIAIGLRRALDGRRLALAYQPLVRLSDGVVIGVEALIRVPVGDEGPGALGGLPDLVSPAELVAVAEDTGEITELGQWVLDEATRQAASWRALGHDILITVNMSVRQLAAEGFVESVAQALEAAALPAGRLAVEITEGQLLSERDPAWHTVEQLRSMGVELMIDDFGSGYSSLAYLRRMPVRGVKLDRDLLDDLSTDPRARTVARAVISAARGLGLLVIAEGLESLEAARIARDLGAYAGQGFALFEAMPADAVTVVLDGPPTWLGTGRPTNDHEGRIDGAGRPLRPVDGHPADGHPADGHPADGHPADGHPADSGSDHEPGQQSEHQADPESGQEPSEEPDDEPSDDPDLDRAAGRSGGGMQRVEGLPPLGLSIDLTDAARPDRAAADLT